MVRSYTNLRTGGMTLTQFSILVITTSTPEKTDGLKALEDAIERIETTIKKLDGHFEVKMAVSYLLALTPVNTKKLNCWLF